MLEQINNVIVHWDGVIFLFKDLSRHLQNSNVNASLTSFDKYQSDWLIYYYMALLHSPHSESKSSGGEVWTKIFFGELILLLDHFWRQDDKIWLIISDDLVTRSRWSLSWEGVIIECPLNWPFHDRRDVIITSQMAISNNFIWVRN